jgi:hypothetical protein
MAEIKTKPTDASVDDFLSAVKDEKRRKDCYTVLRIMKQVTRSEPRMWGPSIVGYGTYHYVYASGHTGDWPVAAFSPRKQSLTVYILSGFPKQEALLKKLGPHTKSLACLYFKSLDGVDLDVLKQIIRNSASFVKKKYG